MTQEKLLKPDMQDTIQTIINNNPVVLFMKGDQKFPMCGFSGYVVQVLKHLGITFMDVNVLADPDLREAVKVFSDWPTIPQLYVKQEFIGGADIVREMLESGELETLFNDMSK